MATSLQRLLTLTYRVATDSGVMRLPGMRSLYEASYGLYKRFAEARYVDLLKTHVPPGTTVIDVGANIGFFTRYFAAWTGPTGRVIAIEPEATNFERLQSMLRSKRLDRIVVAVHAAAAEHAGQVALTIDRYHPAGHYLSPEGVPTPAVTIDDLVRRYPQGVVSFIKIDVQGAELRVLQGATRTLAASRPALLVELDESALRLQHASIEAVVEFLTSYGYHGRLLLPDGLSPACSPRELVAGSLEYDYVDAVFVADATAVHSSP
jgi:FkbM family methyltransferase